MVTTPPLRVGAGSPPAISRAMAPMFGVAGTRRLPAAAHRHHHALVAVDGDHALLVALDDTDSAAVTSEARLSALASSFDVHRALGCVTHHRGAGLDLQVG